MIGIIVPPQEDNIMKVGAVHFVTNYTKPKAAGGISLPRYRTDNPSDTVPAKIETRLRNWLKEFLPDLADREWTTTRICWDGNMPDYNFLISRHPAHSNLDLAIGGSAHAYKFLPVLGKYIVQMMDGTLDAATAKKWEWRPGVEASGYDSNPHPGVSDDLNDLAWC